MNNITATQVRAHLLEEEYWHPTFVAGFFRLYGVEPRTADEWQTLITEYLNTHA